MPAQPGSQLDPPPCHAAGHPAPTDDVYAGSDRLCGVPGDFKVVRCAECGLAGTSPRLGDAQLAAYYPPCYPAFRELPERLDWRGRLGAAIDRRRFSLTVRMAAFGALVRLPPGRLLDVGCGRGELAVWFARRGWTVAGVEPSPQACAQAGAAGIDVHCGTLDDAPWAPSTFDAVTFNHSLEHIPDPGSALAQARDLLAPEGILIVSVPNFGCWQRRLFGSYWFHLDLPRHLQHFERQSLTAMMQRAGLRPARVRTSSSMAGLVGSLQYAFSGRLSLSDATTFRLMHLLYPLVAIGDLFAEGDCLHVVARRG